MAFAPAPVQRWLTQSSKTLQHQQTPSLSTPTPNPSPQGGGERADIDEPSPIPFPWRQHNTSGKQRSCPLCWPSIRAPRPRAPSCFAADISIAASAQQEFPQHFPASGWVEHEPEDIWTSTVATCREALKKAGIGAKDIAAIGITNQRETTVVWDRATGTGGASRHRLAGPPHRRHLRQTEGRRPRAGDLGQNRPDHRSLFLRHQSRLDPRSRPRRAGAGRARRADVRHRRLLSAVAADRRQGARDRRHQRLAHAAVQHPHRAVGRRAVEDPARAALDAPRGKGLLRQVRRQRARIVRRRRSRSPASPATSRPRPSARPASRPA